MATTNTDNTSSSNDVNERLLDLLEHKVVKIPEPIIFTGIKGSIGIIDFFTAFERFCLDRYATDLISWQQVLPTYVQGEALAIVQAFGFGAAYSDVKGTVSLLGEVPFLAVFKQLCQE